MNSGEIYDFTDRPTTAPTANSNPNNPADATTSANTTANTAPQPSLEEEVQQALGAVGRFWGSFRAKAESGLQTARRDMAGVVQQAQRELGKLGGPAPTNAESASTSSTAAGAGTEEPKKDGEGEAAATSETSAPATATEAPSASTSAEASSSSSADATAGAWGVFANIQQTLRTLEASVASGQASQQLQQRTLELRAQLETQIHKAQEGLAPALQRAQTELHDLQTRAQAELAKVQDAAAPTLQRIQSEAGPRAESFLSNASTFLADAVKVVPPEAEETHGVAWDGSDLWDTPSTLPHDTPSVKGKERAGSMAGLGRTEAMLRRVRNDAGLYTGALNEEEEREWTAYAETLKDKGAVAGDAELDALERLLVPEKMGSEAFWQRYHFRVHQVEADEEKRKALLAAQSASQQDDELFSWDDDDDTAAPPSTSPAPTIKEKAEKTTPEKSEGNESEASYDVVSGAASPAKVPETLKEKKKEEDGDDSDWE